MIQRTGQVVIQMLANVRRVTIEPLIRATVLPGTLVYTDEYSIYARLEEWGYIVVNKKRTPQLSGKL